MKYKITALTKTESGTYDESPDMCGDMLNGAACPETIEDMLDWLCQEGYELEGGFIGWGVVLKHETGGLISINEV